MNGAPSVQMQEIPPDLMGFLAGEERTREEKEEEGRNADAGERRDAGSGKMGEFMDREVGGIGDGPGGQGKRKRMF